jgi:hypothetical protein
MTKADRARARQLLRRKLKEQHADMKPAELKEMLENHDESSLMRDMGIMPIPKSLGAQPTWITYNKQF